MQAETEKAYEKLQNKKQKAEAKAKVEKEKAERGGRRRKREDVNNTPVKGDGATGFPVVPSDATPEVKKRALIAATPKQKEMVRRTRERVSQTEGHAVEPSAPAQGPQDKVRANLDLLKAAKAFQVPQLGQGKKSFTMQPDGPDGCSIGILLLTASFYVAKVSFPEGLERKYPTLAGAFPKPDKKAGMSLGWRKFTSVKQACPGIGFHNHCMCFAK